MLLSAASALKSENNDRHGRRIQRETESLLLALASEDFEVHLVK